MSNSKLWFYFIFFCNFFSPFFFVPREVTDSPLWKVYGYAYLVVKLIPSIIICILNMWMLILMKTILKRRRKLRNNPLTRPDLISNSVYNPSDDRRYSNMLTLPMQRIDENNEDCNEQKSSTSGTYSSRSRSKMKKKKNREINLNFFLATFFFYRNRESIRQFKLNGLLLVLAFFHCLTTLPGNIAITMWTIFPEKWAQFDKRLKKSNIPIF